MRNALWCAAASNVGDAAIVLVQNPPLYASHGIPEFWLVDLGGKRLVRHRSPQHGAYALVEEPGLDTPLEVSARSGVVVDLQRLFG